MADFLVLQIKMGKITVDIIPAKWKDVTVEKLNKVD